MTFEKFKNHHMKRIAYLLIAIIVVGSVFIKCKNNQKNSEKYKQSIREWRQERLQNLKADDGWLNLAGLFWLEKGENIIGSEENCDIRFPDQAPEKLGAIYLEEETNAKETYGGGRFLSVKEPDKDNITYIDFNKAYNPPCAFTSYATCPLPPRDNILPIKIQAGEKTPDIDVPGH